MATITVKCGNAGKVDPDPAYVNRGEEVSWVADGNCGFSVDFSDSPFKDNKSHFDKGNNKGAIKPDADKRKYDYTVTINGAQADPGIIVHG